MEHNDAVDIDIGRLAANTIRMLAVDAIETSKSGHPGMPMGMADVAVALFRHVLTFDPSDPSWLNRDRFVLSAGHGSMLLYSILHLCGYDLPLDEIKKFRQLGSITPGHPEHGMTAGVETTTGPLGQGFANGVGMALAAWMMAERLNTPDHKIINHRVYGIVSDGDLMEGISTEAASLAGHLALGNLVYLYDDNEITIEGSTALAFTEDVAAKFEALGWQVLTADGHDQVSVLTALHMACKDELRPSLIVTKTHIGYGAPTKQDTSGVHGSPLGSEEASRTRENLGWPDDARFLIPEEVQELFAERIEEVKAARGQWDEEYDAWRKAAPDKAKLLDDLLAGAMPEDLEAQLLAHVPVAKKATRALSGIALQKAAELVPGLVGGSADLAPSNKSFIEGAEAISRTSFAGKNLHFGIREHAMGAIINGMALYGGFRPYGATFLVFSDYMRPAIRLAALMKLPVIYLFTHDSFYVGEDGPTHQPVEHLTALRSIPNLDVVRPADSTETAKAWAHALQRTDGPTALVLTRQGVAPVVAEGAEDTVSMAGYVVKEACKPDPELLMVATGSEVSLAIEAQAILCDKGIHAKVVSIPCVDSFLALDPAAQEALVPLGGPKKIVLEAGSTWGWHAVVGRGALTVTRDDFGESAPAGDLAVHFGFTPSAVAELVIEKLGK